MSPTPDGGTDGGPTDTPPPPPKGDAGPDATTPPLVPSRVLLFGGFSDINGGSYFRDTWEFDGKSWTSHTGSASHGPPARSDATLAALNGKAYLFGGYLGDIVAAGDFWEWDGATWKELSIPGPSPRYGAAMTSLNGKIILFGGAPAPSNEQPYADTWEFDGTSWTQKLVSGPSGRVGAMAVANGKAILFGGDEHDTWEWDGSSWHELSKITPENQSRTVLSMMNFKGNVFLLDGIYSGSCNNDIWEWSPEWKRKTASPALPYALCGAMSAPLGDVIVRFGGSGYPFGLPAGHKYMDETWAYDGAKWEKLPIAGPAARDRQAMVAY